MQDTYVYPVPCMLGWSTVDEPSLAATIATRPAGTDLNVLVAGLTPAENADVVSLISEADPSTQFRQLPLVRRGSSSCVLDSGSVTEIKRAQATSWINSSVPKQVLIAPDAALYDTLLIDFAHAGKSWDLILTSSKTILWETFHAALVAHVTEHGVLPPEFFVTQNGDPLGSWVSMQRALYAAERMSPARAQRLESIAGWTWASAPSVWELHRRGYERFCSTVRRAPRYSEVVTDVDGTDLGAWAVHQRVDGKSDNLEPWQRNALDATAFWMWDVHMATWEKNLDALKRYMEQNENRIPPRSVVFDGVPIGKWVANQRARHAAKTLGDARVKALEALDGWKWKVREPKKEVTQ